MNSNDVFISYKAEEAEVAGWVKNILEENGISCWMAPGCIPGGSSYAIEIPRAIRQAKVFVLILSSKAQESRWVSKEVDLAINEGKVVLPFMLENCSLRDDFYFYLTNVQRYTAYEDKNAAVQKMLKEIKDVIGIGSTDVAEKTAEKIAEPMVDPVPRNTPSVVNYQSGKVISKIDMVETEQEEIIPEPSKVIPEGEDVYKDQSNEQMSVQPENSPTMVLKTPTNTSAKIKYDPLSIFSIIVAFASIIGVIFPIPIFGVATLILSNISAVNIKRKNLRGFLFIVIAQCLGLITTFLGVVVMWATFMITISIWIPVFIEVVSLIIFIFNCKKSIN